MYLFVTGVEIITGNWSNNTPIYGSILRSTKVNYRTYVINYRNFRSGISPIGKSCGLNFEYGRHSKKNNILYSAYYEP